MVSQAKMKNIYSLVTYPPSPLSMSDNAKTLISAMKSTGSTT